MEYNIFFIFFMVAILAVLGAMYLSQSARRQVREEGLAKENEEIKNVLKAQQQMLEEERARIALDLHDDLAQLLASTRLALGNLRLEPTLSSRNKSLLLRIDHDLNDLLNRVQNIIWNLAPETFQEKGLSYAIWKMCDQLKELRSFHIEFLEMGEVKRLPSEVELLLFRIIQEITSNAMKHSLAWHIFIKMFWSDTQLKVEIKDDGVGKDKTLPTKADSGRGLVGIQKRAEIIGATVTTEDVSKGTLFIISYPFKKK
ncbi:MAG TPA: histidine kinase [Chryseolinea sp.]|nr:histidine kinase [Chryseolinea sp.]